MDLGTTTRQLGAATKRRLAAATKRPHNLSGSNMTRDTSAQDLLEALNLQEYSQVLSAIGVEVVDDFGYVDDLVELDLSDFPVAQRQQLITAARSILSGQVQPDSPASESSAEIAAFSLYASWRDGDSVSEEEYSPRVRRRFRQMVESYEARSPSSGSDVWPNAAMARVGAGSEDELVLMDSGANAVLRSGSCSDTSKSSTPLSVALASGDTIQAFRNRHGEVCLPKERAADDDADDNSWIAGTRRVIELGGEFSWNSSGAFVSYPHPFHAETVHCQCIIQNSLPYISWSIFGLCGLLFLSSTSIRPEDPNAISWQSMRTCT